MSNRSIKKLIICMLMFVMSFSTLLPVLASPVLKDNIIETFADEEMWVAEDFEYDGTVLTGFSELGKTKFENNKDLVIPQNNKEMESITAIADDAFWNGAQVEDEDRIKSLELPATIEAIGKKAFGGNLIKNLEIPAGVKSIDDAAFMSNQIENIIINEGLESVGKLSFSHNKLTEVIIPSSMEELGQRAFYNNKISKLTILPGIEKLGAQCFENNIIQELDIPETVKYIDLGAFVYNSLENIKLPGNLKILGPKSFGVNNIESVTFPETIEWFCPNSFRKNKGFESGEFKIFIDKTVEIDGDIKESVLKDKLSEEIKVRAAVFEGLIDETKHKIDIKSWEKVNEENEHLIYRGKFEEISTEIIKIIEEAEGCGSGSENIIENMQRTSLIVKVKLTGELLEPEDPTEPTEPEEPEEPGEIWDSKYFTFEETTLTGFSESGQGKFREDKELVIPEKTIEEKIVDSIGDRAFNLDKYEENGDGIRSLILPKTIKTIGSMAFRNNNIVHLELPNSVEELGDGVFAANGDLKTLKLSNNLTKIPNGAFSFSKIKELVIPEGVTEIGGSAFSDNSLLSDLTISGTVEKITSRAFMNVVVVDLTIPGSVKTIEASAFSGGTLSSLILEEGIETIGSDAFKRNKLSEVTIPKSVTKLEKSAFNLNPNINIKYALLIGILEEAEEIETEGKTQESVEALQAAIDAGKVVNNKPMATLDEVKEAVKAIADAMEGLAVPVPDFEFADGMITKYNGTATDLVIPEKINGEEVTAIKASVFKNKNLISVKIPDTVQNIGMGAFAQNKLTAIELPEALTEMGNMAFYDNELTSVKIPNGLAVIPTAAFSKNKLTSAEIPESVTSIAMKAFEDNNLEEIVIPSGVNDIGASAFENNVLGEVIIPPSVDIIGNKAFDGNENIKLTYSILVEAISEAEEIETEGKTQESVEALQAAINAGKVVNNKPMATLDEVKEAAEAIADAMEGLEDESSKPIIIKNIEKTKINDKIKITISVSAKKDINGILIIKPINENRRSYKVICEPKEFINGNNEIKIELEPLNYPKDIKGIEAYIWDSLENMGPLADVGMLE